MAKIRKNFTKTRVSKKISTKSFKNQVLDVLQEIRPAIQMDGGDVELRSLNEKEGLVTIRLSGACQGCPLSEITLKQGIEQTLRQHIAGVRSVVTE
jgi:Fe-S cluster biogenesis protein NfuA